MTADYGPASDAGIRPHRRSHTPTEVQLTRIAPLLALLVLLLLAACRPQPEDTLTPLPTSAMGVPTVAYPGPAASPTTAAGYPAAPEATPTSDAYPAGSQLWIIRSAGLQCEDPVYPTLESATTALQQAGVAVLAAEETTRAVCAACGCPTSAFYRVQIDGGDLAAAAPLGWVPE
jgi:hypothetical protein